MNRYRESLPESVFGPALIPNVTDGSGSNRKALRRALKLLTEAGWKRDGSTMKNAKGETLSVEVLIRAPVFERILGRYVESMKKIGIDATIRLVDPTQFQARLDSFDFDMAGIAVSLGASPTAESLSQFLHSDSASRERVLQLSGDPLTGHRCTGGKNRQSNQSR